MDACRALAPIISAVRDRPGQSEALREVLALFLRTLHRKLDEEVRKAKDFEAMVTEAQALSKKEKEDLQAKIDDLKAEIQELSPSGDLDSVRDCHGLRIIASAGTRVAWQIRRI